MEALIEEIRLLVGGDNPFDYDDDLLCVRNQIMMLRHEKQRVNTIAEGITKIYRQADEHLIVKLNTAIKSLNCEFVNAVVLGWHLSTPVGYIQIKTD